ncbi:MAG: glycoside hydrolase 100 family protein [Bacteroidota bacterium]
MNYTFENLYEESIGLLHRLITPHGLLASTVEEDNYKRIWARDSVVCGIAGLKVGDTLLTEALKNSLGTLARHQHELGMIPSNVDPISGDVSYGSLVGRIDANTWFIIGSCLYHIETGDGITWDRLKPAVDRCRKFLKSVEYNDKGWLYTPLSGNWADEYPVHGYTLYDNILRLWGESLWNKVIGKGMNGLKELKERTLVNFWPLETTDKDLIYHSAALAQMGAGSLKHFLAYILPGKYDTRFDAAGNALALLQYDITKGQKEALLGFMDDLTSELSRPLIPAFWPVITAESADWDLLQGNYSFSFKNHPGDFHNGGIWPVWMGLFCLGLAQNGLQNKARDIIEAFTKTVNENDDWNFQEYMNAYSLKVGGKTQMGYTASGIVFMKLALQA